MRTRGKKVNAAGEEAKEKESTGVPPNEEWLALSTTISLLGEADLMALDEDLQEVPWGTIGQGAHHQILSPLTALAETQTLSGLSTMAFNEMAEWGATSGSLEGMQTHDQVLSAAPSTPAPETGDPLTQKADSCFTIPQPRTPKLRTGRAAESIARVREISEPSLSEGLNSVHEEHAGQQFPTSQLASLVESTSLELPLPLSLGLSSHLTLATPTKMDDDIQAASQQLRPLSGLGLSRRISFSIPQAGGQLTSQLSADALKDKNGTRSSSPFCMGKRSASPFHAIKSSNGSSDTLRSINLMVNRAQVITRGRPRSAGGGRSSSMSSRSAAPSPAPRSRSSTPRPPSATPRPSSRASTSTPRPPSATSSTTVRPCSPPPPPTAPPTLLPLPLSTPPTTTLPLPMPAALPPVPGCKLPLSSLGSIACMRSATTSNNPSQLQQLFAPKTEASLGRPRGGGSKGAVMRSFGGSLGGTLLSLDKADSPLAFSSASTIDVETPNKEKRAAPVGTPNMRESKIARNASGGGINFTVKPSPSKGTAS
uniref:Uncharacterized protein n=1 Tax=Haptolina brevifila TaxID=156173 RepID=A0A7S2DMK9_9EUKA|mmetsp:Transcript_4121/g.8916  ORF Transcript_4121/g.8916 Transcript_4121/m.8916 type:complete len:539 (+) Transcript_4121:39-1655(+)